jgi:hypothetical protein
MSYLSSPKYIKSFLAILVVFIMTTGAFISVVGNSNENDGTDGVTPNVPVLPEVEETKNIEPSIDSSIELPADDGFSSSTPELEFPEPEVPTVEPIDDVESIVGDDIFEADMNDYAEHETIQSTSGNSFSDAMQFITDDIQKPVQPEEQQETGTRATYSTMIELQADNDQNPGQGRGRVYKSGSNYYSYEYYMMYNYISGTSYENRGWAVYDLSDLQNYGNVKVTSAQIHWRLELVPPQVHGLMRSVVPVQQNLDHLVHPDNLIIMISMYIQRYQVAVLHG